MSALRDALLVAAEVVDADPVSDDQLCVAIAACREAGALMGYELNRRADPEPGRMNTKQQAYRAAINRETQKILDALAAEAKARSA